MILDDIDIKILRENFDDELISRIDSNNVLRILKYLDSNDIYYAKDLLLTSLDLFLLPCEEFIKRFEHLKTKLGSSFAEKLGNDASLIEIMYEKKI